MKTFLTFFALGCALPAIAFASGQTEPRIEPEPGHSGPQVYVCPPQSDNAGQVYTHPWVRDCYNQPDRPREPECTMWKPGTLLATKQKECA